MVKRHRAILFAVVLMIAATTIIAPVGSRRPQAAKAWDFQNLCWPDNRAGDDQTSGGESTSASGSIDHLAFTGAGKERLGVDSDLGKGTLTIQDFAALIDITSTPSIMKGKLDATIDWIPDNGGPSLPQTVFQGGCVAEVGTVNEDPDPACISNPDFARDLEVEFEGWVKDFPGYPGTTKAAVASMTVNASTDIEHPCTFDVKLNIELGTTCNENYPSFPVAAPDLAPFSGDIEIAINVKDVDPGSFTIDNVRQTLANFPPGYTKTTCRGYNDVELVTK